LPLRAPTRPAASERAQPPRQPPPDAPPAPRRPPSAVARRRRLLALLGLALVGLVALIGVSLLTRGGETPPATGAATLVPADALAYVNLSIDPNRGAVKQATTLGAHFPGYPRLLGNVESRVGGIVSGGASVDFARDVAPWLGDEAAGPPSVARRSRSRRLAVAPA
jgi:hypothetical protein